MYLPGTESDRADPGDMAESRQEPRRRNRALWWALPVAGLALLGTWRIVGAGGDAPPPPPPGQVTVSTPLVRDVAEWDDYTGRFRASQSVEIRPRVSGALDALHFRDGDIVRKGQLLFTIDPRPFAAAYREAQARTQGAVTALALARADVARAERLIADEAVSREEVDTLRARVQSSIAALAAARAQADARRLDVEFTRVRSPVTGRVSDRRVDVGNLVSGEGGGGGTVLTTVNALDPIYFEFDGSEALYLKQQRAGRQGAEVQIRLQDEPTYRWRGRVDFTDNAIDQGSGTIRGRATVANPANFLTPGLFGNMRLGSGKPTPALLVPDSAITTDIARKTVYVLGAGDKVAARQVTVGPLVDGLRVIRSGIGRQDRVVISGLHNAQPGAVVKPVAGRIVAQRAAAEGVVAADPPASQATFAR